LVFTLEEINFSDYAKEFSEEIWKLGASPLKEPESPKLWLIILAAKECCFRL
jgi:hypothetical protein